MAIIKQPAFLPGPIAYGGDRNTIPITNDGSQGFASIEKGFPAITQKPIAQGGLPPQRGDFNGLFNLLSQYIIYQQNGGLYAYNADFDYGPLQLVTYSDKLWICAQSNGPSTTAGAQAPADGSAYWGTIGDIKVTDNNGQITIDTSSTSTTFQAALNILKRNQAYAVGDIAYSPNLPSWAYLKCTQAGTTAETEPVFGGGGKSVTDGTTIWRIKDSRCPYTLGQFVCKLGEPKDYEYLLLCDGSTISATDYPELCAVLGGTQLPNLIGRVLQGDSVGGTYKAPGLPNIIGAMTGNALTTNFLKDSLEHNAFEPTGHYDIQGGSHVGSGWRGFTFNASRSDAIYGASTTVQPPAYTTKIYICYAG